MKCQSCGKRDATVHLTEIKDGVKHEMHLCESCAAEKGLPGKAHFSIAELLAGLASVQQGKGKREREAQCPTCEMTLSQFQSSGRFGCPDCYAAFKGDILPLLAKIHDAAQHVGKVPPRLAPEVNATKRLRQLQLELKRVVKREDFEQAALLRDQVRRLEEELKALLPARNRDRQPGAERSEPEKDAPETEPRD